MVEIDQLIGKQEHFNAFLPWYNELMSIALARRRKQIKRPQASWMVEIDQLMEKQEHFKLYEVR